MSEGKSLGRDPAKYREVAETLRGIAEKTRFDACRVGQLHALADGFKRLAERLEREMMDEAAD
jgi:hypothetical protein